MGRGNAVYLAKSLTVQMIFNYLIGFDRSKVGRAICTLGWDFIGVYIWEVLAGQKTKACGLFIIAKVRHGNFEGVIVFYTQGSFLRC